MYVLFIFPETNSRTTHESRLKNIKQLRKECSSAEKLKTKKSHLPAITLESFFEEDAYVCRHNALLIADMLSRLINDEYLDDGKIFIIRGPLVDKKGKDMGGHAWVLYQNTESGDLWMIDGYWNLTLNLSDEKDYSIALKVRLIINDTPTVPVRKITGNNKDGVKLNSAPYL